MSVYVDDRPDGGFALYIDGDLQFDTDDEAVYHESMALPALSLARPRDAGIRALICGGGDGLALRECLRYPRVASVDLVDYDPSMIELARTRFAGVNGRAFEDPRAAVHVMDAWEFLDRPASFDVVLCDFTVPRTEDEARIFTREWYARVAGVLSPGGVAVINGLSPQATPEAFWCLYRTIRAAGLSALPYRVCIPSFRDHGYGVWSFFLAAHRPLRQDDLRTLVCPVATRQTDLSALWRGARFTRAERAMSRLAPVHTVGGGQLVQRLLNPGRAANSGYGLASPDDVPFDLSPLIDAIPITHPYHTRSMVETLAEQVIGTVRALDVRRLVEELLRRAARLPGDLVGELRRLRDFLRERAEAVELTNRWVYRLFAALVITMTLANAVAPDNAFAKGSAGLGHASMSRGYSGGFGGGRGLPGMPGGAASPAPVARVTGRGFRSGYGRGRMVDIHGHTYRPRYFTYCGGGHGHVHPRYVVGGGHRHESHEPAPPPVQRQALFVADEDMMVLDNGDIVITLSDRAYLLVVNGTVSLMSAHVPDPLLPVYPDPNLFRAIQAEIEHQKAGAAVALRERRDWLSWVGWTSALFPTVAEDRSEVRHLEDMRRRLSIALQQAGQPFAGAAAAVAPARSVELFVGCFLTEDGKIQIRGRDGVYVTDGKKLRRHESNAIKDLGAAPAELAVVLRTVMDKLKKELAADIASDTNDLRLLESDRRVVERDLAEYQRIYASNFHDPHYEVDYGTASIGVADAIALTNRDLAGVRREYDETNAAIAKATADYARIDATLASFGK